MDTDSTATILSGIRFVSAKPTGYEPTPENKILVNRVSSHLVFFSVERCNMLLATRPKFATLQVWFTRHLPTYALIGSNAVTLLHHNHSLIARPCLSFALCKFE